MSQSHRGCNPSQQQISAKDLDVSTKLLWGDNPQRRQNKPNLPGIQREVYRTLRIDLTPYEALVSYHQ